MGEAEFDLIARIRARIADAPGVVLGIGDDAALLEVPPGRQLVVTTDTCNAGVHFPRDTLPADIGWKALAVNLSDLAAMGATPAWCTLSLSLPRVDIDWMDAFLDGFLALAQMHAMTLVGGDTTRGEMSIAVTAMGLVEPGHALRRDRARIGDDVWVTGTLGDAAAALAALADGRTPAPAQRQRLDRPQPRVAGGRALQGLAHACVDVSDGLLADLGHVCVASSVGAQIWLDHLPASAVMAACDAAARWRWQASGGDDYELCFTAPPRLREEILLALEFAGVQGTRIGRIVEGAAVQALDAQGEQWLPPQRGYQHFT